MMTTISIRSETWVRQQATTGRQIEVAARLRLAQNGATVAGRKLQRIVKDDC